MLQSRSKVSSLLSEGPPKAIVVCKDVKGPRTAVVMCRYSAFVLGVHLK